MHVTLAYGRTGLDVTLPDTQAVTVIEPRYVPGLTEERAAISAALSSPLGSPPLVDLIQPRDRVAVVFSDLTRPMPNDRVLPVLLSTLAEAGVPPDHITLINALGTHRAQTQDELDQMLGPEVAVAVTRNASGRMVRVHRAYVEASVRILTGFVEPHFFAGFSGGPKAVLPGIADIDAILDNHGAAMLSHPKATWAITEGNPLWEEIRDVAMATHPTFLLNVTLNRHQQITGVFAGDLLTAHRAATEFVRTHALQPVAAPYDIVITSNSGYPLDLNLYQAVKGMSAAAQIVRPGGHIIIAAECWDGIPDHGEYGRLLREAPSVDALLRRSTYTQMASPTNRYARPSCSLVVLSSVASPSYSRRTLRRRLPSCLRARRPCRILPLRAAVRSAGRLRAQRPRRTGQQATVSQ